jgi:hypothetical protein
LEFILVRVEGEVERVRLVGDGVFVLGEGVLGDGRLGFMAWLALSLGKCLDLCVGLSEGLLGVLLFVLLLHCREVDFYLLRRRGTF